MLMTLPLMTMTLVTLKTKDLCISTARCVFFFFQKRIHKKIFGENLEKLRKAAKLSQASLSKLSGIPRTTITHFESGIGNPSLSNLIKIAKALQISVEELLIKPRTDSIYIPADQLPSKLKKGATVQKLLPDKLPSLEFERMTLPKGVGFAGVPHIRGTKEYFTCVQGKFEIYVSGERFIVKKGDVLSFFGDQPHSYRNVSSTESVGISVVSLGS